MHLSDDKQLASIEIEGSFDAARLEALITELSALRSAMTPPVPAMPPMTNNTEDAAAARARGDPFVQVAVMRNGVTRFWVRHGGLGWFGFNLPVERANMLASYILDLTSQGDRSVDLTRVKRRMSDLSH
ncbi:MAG TPA: hypothetical protein VM073_04780 [Usitatibacter sp.]|nr:hypothetical protein [Usitatibacter sp.]